MKTYTPAPLLFSKKDLGQYYMTVEERALKEIRELDRRFFLEAGDEDLLRYFEERYRVDPLRLDLDGIETTDETVGVDISQDFMRAIADRSRPYFNPTPLVNFHIPFSGDAGLFDYAPYIDLNPPRGHVQGKFLIVPVVAFDGNIGSTAPTFEREKARIISSVHALNNQIENLGNKFSQLVLSGIRAQKKIFEHQQSALDALPYPKKTNKVDIVPVKRRYLPISSMPPIGASYEDNPILPLDEYNFILKTMFGMIRVMESAPDDFKSLGETAMRQHLLVQLNGLYEGAAKGEVFNGKGKTDILIPYKNRNIFIGECKIYGGPQTVIEAIDQLLGYMMWRDTKGALILFSRKKDFTDVIEKVKAAATNHPNCIKELSSSEETIFRFQFAQKHDSKRKMLLSVLLFNVPAE